MQRASYYEPPDPDYSCRYMVVTPYFALSDVDLYCNKWDEDGSLIEDVWLCQKHVKEWEHYVNSYEDK
jgi:hypothetical protein